MKLRKALAALAFVSTAALALSGCTGGSKTSSDDGKLRVVVTTTQLADFTSIVGGDDIHLTSLLHPGASAHHFDPSPADLIALSRADVLVINGAGLEGFIDSAIEASGFHGTIIDASTGVDIDLAREITLESGAAGHEGEDHDHATDAAADAASHEDEHDHEGHEDHDHGDLNPHLWTSIRFAQGMTAMIAGDLARIDPDHSAGYTTRADTYLAQLTALDAWAAAQFERVPAAERLLVSGHDSLTYFLHDYDIEFIGSILKSFEDNAEPSAAEIEALVARIREAGVRAIFVESSMNPALARTIAREAGITVIDADSLYADALGGTDSGAETYLDATVHNVTTILRAWGAIVDPLPEELQ